MISLDFHTAITNKYLKWMENPSSQNVYYHYTKKTAKDSIELEKLIWATESRKLQVKDKNEIKECEITLRKIIEDRDLIPIFSEFFKFFKREMDVGNLNFFILSTTKTIPSQRHIDEYGEGEGHNYIPIDSSFITDNNKPENPKIEYLFSHDVIYEVEEKKRLLNELVDEMEKALTTIHSTQNVINAKKTPEIQQVFLACIQVVIIYSSVFKDKEYSWEDEHRFVYLRLSRFKKPKRKINLKIN
jgi:hypothetical protein